LAFRLLLLIALQPQQGTNAMTHTDSAVHQNQIQRSLVPMLRTWTRSIGWTVLLSALLAILFALAVDGCAGIH
jgi:inner membrane protein involved in colicin E2 resistance